MKTQFGQSWAPTLLSVRLDHRIRSAVLSCRRFPARCFRDPYLSVTLRDTRLLSLWLAIIVVALAIHLGGFPLLDPDEGRNAEVGREMAATNDYVMPRLDGLPYLDKPIVYFAAEAAVMEVLGPTELAARLPAFLFTLATAWFTGWFARRLWGKEAALVAAVVTLATPLAVAFSRTVIFDSALSFFITVATAAFYLAIEGDVAVESIVGDAGSATSARLSINNSTPARTPIGRRWTILAWAAIGFGVITKGPVAILLPLLVAIPYAVTRRRLRAVISIPALIVFAVVVAPWVWAISRAVPDFLHYVLVTETAQRMATKALKRTGPPWYFIPYVIGGAMPWSILLLSGTRQMERRDRSTLYLLLWILLPFIFFSISQSKRPQYVLPLMPAIALLVARVWPGAQKAARIAAIALAAVGAILVTAPLFVHLRDEYGDSMRTTAIGLGIAAMAGATLALFARRRDLALIGLSLPIVAIPLIANPLLLAIGTRRSTREFDAQLERSITAQTEVVGVEAFTGSMAFYLRRPIIVVTPDAEELTSNYLIRHYGTFAGGAVLKPMSWLASSLADPTHARAYIVRANDAAQRNAIAAHGLRVVAANARYVAYAQPPSTPLAARPTQ